MTEHCDHQNDGKCSFYENKAFSYKEKDEEMKKKFKSKHYRRQLPAISIIVKKKNSRWRKLKKH